MKILPRAGTPLVNLTFTAEDQKKKKLLNYSRAQLHYHALSKNVRAATEERPNAVYQGNRVTVLHDGNQPDDSGRLQVLQLHRLIAPFHRRMTGDGNSQTEPEASNQRLIIGL